MRLEMDERTERERIRRAREGDLGAMESIYVEHKPMIFAVGMAVCGNASDADDVVQETFLRAFRSLGQWSGESSFRSWLYAVGLRTAQNWKSRFVNRKAGPAPAAVEAPEDRGEERALLMAGIAELPEKQRLTLLLKHIRGLTIREIAELEGCAEGTVKANLHHAVSALVRKFGKAVE